MRARLVAALLALLTALLAGCGRPEARGEGAFRQKADLLWKEVRADWELRDEAPAGEAGCVVFFSVCDGSRRADVRSGSGETLEAAWSAAVRETEAFLREDGLFPRWVKADVVCASETAGADRLARELTQSRDAFFHRGLAFDGAFGTALLEAELNGAKIYDYENGRVNLNYLNSYLKRAGRETLEALPETYTLFLCRAWFCGEDGAVHALIPDGPDGGRRRVEVIDRACVEELLIDASAFLADMVKEDGSFVYGFYPRFDNELEGCNIVRHTGAIWSLLCRYRMAPDEALAEKIERAIDYMLTQVRYDEAGRAYLYEAKSDEIKLGGCGIAVVAMTEYMDVFRDGRYREVCTALGEGILTMLDQSSGEYYHVLNGDFSRKEAYRTVYYDGEATFALCRLYGLTGEERWLDAARSAADRFIAADYTRYQDHWVAYSMNELTRYVEDEPAYYAFALENARKNLEEIRCRDTASHTYLELLMAAFEVYDRMADAGMAAESFDLDALLQAIYARADRMLSGYFYPECAMYMANPQRILGTFMVRHEGYRVRIDDVQHNIGGYYLFWKNYDRLTAYGLRSAPADPRPAP